jgi:ATP-dependent RNA helicase DeaD
MTRLWLSVGSEHGISPAHVKGCILGETGVPAETLGRIDLRERHTFVELSNSQVTAVLPKLNRAYLGGRRLKAKVA